MFLVPWSRGDQPLRLLPEGEETCLVTNSLKLKPHLESNPDLEAGAEHGTLNSDRGQASWGVGGDESWAASSRSRAGPDASLT